MAIVFYDTDLKGTNFLHDDPLVISPTTGNSKAKQVLVDSEVSLGQ